MNTSGNRSGQDGFTLLETIIAFLILALSLSMTVQTISSGAKTFHRAADLQRANLVMNELASVQLSKLTKSGEQNGQIGESGWTIKAQKIDDKYPGGLIAVEVAIRPRGDDGPVFDYFTFVTFGEN
ncbi:MAG: prepilin-type N-terminal cleavage/methylation domain-containing protein [Rhizobiaceae bacterium]